MVFLYKWTPLFKCFYLKHDEKGEEALRWKFTKGHELIKTLRTGGPHQRAGSIESLEDGLKDHNGRAESSLINLGVAHCLPSASSSLELRMNRPNHAFSKTVGVSLQGISHPSVQGFEKFY